jgi:hypothetical protein
MKSHLEMLEIKMFTWMLFILTRPSSSYSYSHGHGIQHEITFASLAEAGCTACHEATPTSGITSALIGSCSGPHIFVGAGLSNSSPSISIGAYMSIDEVMNNRTPYLSNGVYWYYRKGHYLGFFDRPDVLESNYPDGTDNYEIHEIQHGSLWNIDGFGLQSRLNVLKSNSQSSIKHHPRNSDLQKWIYNCPGKLMFMKCLPLSVSNFKDVINLVSDFLRTM